MGRARLTGVALLSQDSFVVVDYTATGTFRLPWVSTINTYVKNNFAHRTYENAESVMTFFAAQFGDKDLGAFTLEDLEKDEAERVVHGVGRTTIKEDWLHDIIKALAGHSSLRVTEG